MDLLGKDNGRMENQSVRFFKLKIQVENSGDCVHPKVKDVIRENICTRMLMVRNITNMASSRKRILEEEKSTSSKNNGTGHAATSPTSLHILANYENYLL